MVPNAGLWLGIFKQVTLSNAQTLFIITTINMYLSKSLTIPIVKYVDSPYYLVYNVEPPTQYHCGNSFTEVTVLRRLIPSSKLLRDKQ